MSFNLTTSGAIITKAGAGVNANIAASGAFIALFCDMAEGMFMMATRHNWINSNSTAQFSGAISDAVSSWAANKLVAYDLSGYFSRAEAQTILDFNDNTFQQITGLLKDEKYREVMGVST